jgi:hypothetical protein
VILCVTSDIRPYSSLTQSLATTTTSSTMAMTAQQQWRQQIIVFESPILWTAKRPETGPKWTDLDRTVGCGLRTFRMEGPVATSFNTTGLVARYPL